MSRFKIREAVAQDVPLRVLFLGFSKDGKTQTAIQVAYHLAASTSMKPEDILVIESETIGDTDKGRSETVAGTMCLCGRCEGRGLKLVGHRILVLPANARGPDDYIEAFGAAAQAGAKILIVDGITPEWEWCLRQVDQHKGRKEQAWADITPFHDRFLKAIESYPGHLMATCRVKDKAVVKGKEDGGWSKKPFDPIQRDQLEYIFDIVIAMNSGNASAESRRPALHNKRWQRPGADVVDLLLAWSKGLKIEADAMAAAKATADAEAQAKTKAEMEECLAYIAALPDTDTRKATALQFLADNGTKPNAHAKLLARLKVGTPDPQKPGPSSATSSVSPTSSGAVSGQTPGPGATGSTSGVGASPSRASEAAAGSGDAGPSSPGTSDASSNSPAPGDSPSSASPPPSGEPATTSGPRRPQRRR